jgi:hypothetical protein
MTPERIAELREIVNSGLYAWGGIASSTLAECLDEIENYRRSLNQVNRTVLFQGKEIERLRDIIEEANGVGFPYEEMARKVRGET